MPSALMKGAMHSACDMSKQSHISRTVWKLTYTVIVSPGGVAGEPEHEVPPLVHVITSCGM